ncbi:hypothetical protein [Pacificimonas flava]|uniref:Uncharacterized protein n=1 Tax=Pacificimonas flava TaxID=1234595 RepID=M2U326_9SPHN|nr:hypothetical protein [Pacificimonas flava]EMD82372.1 hypothetical protein C725_2093 [Pacificimonas flava]MBB5281207.1 hypothetical protein [Pacificimonas flava]
MGENRQAAGEAIEIESDRRFQERLWTLQRVCWLVMFGLVCAALLGATGAGGSLAAGKTSGMGASVEYPRIARWQRAERVEISLAPSAMSESQLLLGRGFLDSFSVSSMTPQPKATQARSDGVLLTFGKSPGAPGTVSIMVRPEKPSLPKEMHLTIDGARLSFTSIVLP